MSRVSGRCSCSLDDIIGNNRRGNTHAVVDSFLRLLPGIVARQGLQDGLEARLVEVGKCEAVPGVQADLVGRGGQVGVRHVLKHVTWCTLASFLSLLAAEWRVRVVLPWLTWEDCEGTLDRRDVDPTLIVLLQTRRRLLPVGELLALVGGADEEAAYVVLRRDDKQTVVGVASDAPTRLALSVGLVRGGEPGRWVIL